MGKKYYMKDGEKVYLKEEEIKDEDEDKEEGEEKKDGEEDDEDENIDKAAKRIAKSLASKIPLDQIKDLSDQVKKLTDRIAPGDSKLQQILNGKDYVKDVDKLTKEETIIGFFHALVTGNDHAVKALSIGTAADGGDLVPADFLAELNRDLQDMVVFRQICRVIPMRRNTMTIPRVTSAVKTYWTAENAAKTTTTAAFTQDTLTAFKQAAILYASDELIEDSRDMGSFDIVRLIITLFAEALAQEEEASFAVGNGTTRPLGLETARAAGTFATIAAVDQNFDDIIRLEHSLKPQYRANASFLCNDLTVRNMRLLKDSQNRYLWQDPVAAGQPATFHGYRVYTSLTLPHTVVYFGDFKRGFWIGDRGQVSVKVTQDSETAFVHDQTAIRVVERVGSQVVLPAALKAMNGF